MDDVLMALRTVVALAAVLGLLIFLSRRLQNSQSKGESPFAGLVPKKLSAMSHRLSVRPAVRPKARPEKIMVVARAGLSGKAQLVVAEFGGIRYILGVTEQGVSVVDTQEAPMLPEEYAPNDEDKAGEFPIEQPDDILDRALRSVA